jgi:hypothetical protein
MLNRSELSSLIESLLGKHPDGMAAYSFLCAYGTFAHAVDDLIDEKITDPEAILKTFQLYAEVLSSSFYRKYFDYLYPLVCNINNTYADSVVFEKSSEQWKREHADNMRTCGNDMAVMVVKLLCGYDDSRRVSLLFREDSYKHHHDEQGNPV